MKKQYDVDHWRFLALALGKRQVEMLKALQSYRAPIINTPLAIAKANVEMFIAAMLELDDHCQFALDVIELAEAALGVEPKARYSATVASRANADDRAIDQAAATIQDVFGKLRQVEALLNIANKPTTKEAI